jgi:hypothetical protein
VRVLRLSILFKSGRYMGSKTKGGEKVMMPNFFVFLYIFFA